jgi:hypothetical protein
MPKYLAEMTKLHTLESFVWSLNGFLWVLSRWFLIVYNEYMYDMYFLELKGVGTTTD